MTAELTQTVECGACAARLKVTLTESDGQVLAFAYVEKAPMWKRSDPEKQRQQIQDWIKGR